MTSDPIEEVGLSLSHILVQLPSLKTNEGVVRGFLERKIMIFWAIISERRI